MCTNPNVCDMTSCLDEACLYFSGIIVRKVLLYQQCSN